MVLFLNELPDKEQKIKKVEQNEDKGKIIVLNYLYVAISNYKCYKCGKRTKVLAFAVSDFIDTNNKNKKNPFGNKLLFIQNIKSMISLELNEYLERKYYYYEDDLKNSDIKYFINHCSYTGCDIYKSSKYLKRAKFGDYFILEEENNPFSINNIDGGTDFLLYKVKLDSDLIIEGKILYRDKEYLRKDPDKIREINVNDLIRRDARFEQDNINCDIYIGKDCGDVILKSISDAKKQIKIISPYLSPEYIEILEKKANDKIDIKLLTSKNFIEKNLNKNTKTNEFLKKIPYLGKLDGELQKYLIFFGAIILYGCIFYNDVIKGVSAVLILGVLLKFFPFKDRFQLNRLETKFPVKFYPYRKKDFEKYFPFMHSKIYIIDDTVYLGSLNFTKSGFVHSLESRVVIKDENAVKEFNKLFNEIDVKGDYLFKVPFFNQILRKI